MVKYPIPLVDQEVDTDDGASGVAMPVVKATAGFVTLFGATGLATWAYNRIRTAAGVEKNQQIPGV